MNSALFVHRYRLTLRAGPGNARSRRRELEGFLLRTGDGFGCVHPWPELGDPDVDELIARLRGGRPHRLLERALACAMEDGLARREGRSLFAGLTIPRSHATVTGDENFPALFAAGFRTVKLKTHGSDSALPARVRAASDAGLNVRIDCNGTGTAALPALLPWREAIEFIEDPESYDPARWSAIRDQLGIPLALDRLPEELPEAGGFDVRILKPALETCRKRDCDAVITSSMDHPLGQMFAALAAARYAGRQREAGLLTHVLFEPDAFTEAVQAAGPQLLVPEGTGLGFDALLDRLEWERISSGGPAVCGSSQVRPWEAPDFWERTEPVLLTNPRNPLPDPPRDLPEGCLVFATSGSTGAASLACLSRAAMLANAEAVNEWLDATGEDVWLRVLPVFHVGGMSIHARAWLTGSRVVSDDGKWDPHQFTALAESSGATLASLVPAQVYDLVRTECRAPLRLRAVVTGGGALSPALFRKARALAWPILPSYGMTEASSQIATARPGIHASLPPLELLPCWEARTGSGGRLQLRGAPLLSARLNRTASGWTSENPLDADGWFTTSDLAELSGRRIAITGRCDRTVKVLGELVDLNAVETALTDAGMPPERGAVVPLPDARAGFRPWLVTDLTESEAADLIAAANTKLPPYAGIAGARRVSILPRSPLGKILRAEAEAMVTTPE